MLPVAARSLAAEPARRILPWPLAFAAVLAFLKRHHFIRCAACRHSPTARLITPAIARPRFSSTARPHQPRPSFGHEAPFLGLMGASASAFAKASADRDALVLFVSVASDAPASSRPRGLPEGRDYRGRNDGGKHACTDDNRTDAPDADRAMPAPPSPISSSRTYDPNAVSNVTRWLSLVMT
jgi:hypothetical protein